MVWSTLEDPVYSRESRSTTGPPQYTTFDFLGLSILLVYKGYIKLMNFNCNKWRGNVDIDHLNKLVINKKATVKFHISFMRGPSADLSAKQCEGWNQAYRVWNHSPNFPPWPYGLLQYTLCSPGPDTAL